VKALLINFYSAKETPIFKVCVVNLSLLRGERNNNYSDR